MTRRRIWVDVWKVLAVLRRRIAANEVVLARMRADRERWEREQKYDYERLVRG